MQKPGCTGIMMSGNMLCTQEYTIRRKQRFVRKRVARCNSNLRWPGEFLEVLSEAGIRARGQGFYAH